MLETAGPEADDEDDAPRFAFESDDEVADPLVAGAFSLDPASPFLSMGLALEAGLEEAEGPSVCTSDLKE